MGGGAQVMAMSMQNVDPIFPAPVADALKKLEDRYPMLQFHANATPYAGDYITIVISSPEHHETLRISNTQLSTLYAANHIYEFIAGHIEKYFERPDVNQPEQTTETTGTDWVDEWVKEHELS